MPNPTAAARRLLAGPRSYRDGTHSEQADVQTVAEAVLSVNDDTPIDEAWLRSVGFEVTTSDDWWQAQYVWNANDDRNELVLLQNACFVSQGPDESIEVPKCPTTRGQLRMLAE